MFKNVIQEPLNKTFCITLDGEKYTAIDLTLGTTQELYFAASIATTVILETEEDKMTFTEAIVEYLEESDEGKND